MNKHFKLGDITFIFQDVMHSDLFAVEVKVGDDIILADYQVFPGSAEARMAALRKAGFAGFDFNQMRTFDPTNPLDPGRKKTWLTPEAPPGAPSALRDDMRRLALFPSGSGGGNRHPSQSERDAVKVQIMKLMEKL